MPESEKFKEKPYWTTGRIVKWICAVLVLLILTVCIVYWLSPLLVVDLDKKRTPEAVSTTWMTLLPYLGGLWLGAIGLVLAQERTRALMSQADSSKRQQDLELQKYETEKLRAEVEMVRAQTEANKEDARAIREILSQRPAQDLNPRDNRPCDPTGCPIEYQRAVHMILDLHEEVDIHKELHEMRLTGVLFEGRDLSGFTFSKCCLENACFDQVNLTDAVFAECHMEDSSFKGADISGAVFQKLMRKGNNVGPLPYAKWRVDRPPHVSESGFDQKWFAECRVEVTHKGPDGKGHLYSVHQSQANPTPPAPAPAPS